MTNKQLAKQLRDIGNLLFVKTYDPNFKLLLDEAGDRLERKDTWISVEDELPELFVNVLVCRNGKIEIDYNEDDGWFAYDFDEKRVAHWMPLPAPPTEKEN